MRHGKENGGWWFTLLRFWPLVLIVAALLSGIVALNVSSSRMDQRLTDHVAMQERQRTEDREMLKEIRSDVKTLMLDRKGSK
jgi:Ni/Fe-hydrogenase subunit HybB-like protein